MNEADFKKLSTDGKQFENLVYQLVEATGYRILSRPAVGADGGCDILVERQMVDRMHNSVERVLVQCKHYATSENDVADRHLGVWTNAMLRYDAKGYLLVTDTRVTENLKRAFEAFSKKPGPVGCWADFWDVDDLLLLLEEHTSIRRTFFPDKSPCIAPPSEVGKLVDNLRDLAEKSDKAFDRGDWARFALHVAETRRALSDMAKSEQHFSLYYHMKRSPEFPRLQHLLSTQQLAYERLNESHAVEQIDFIPKTIKSLDEFTQAIGTLDAFRQVTFDLTRSEADWLREFARDPKSMVMVGCGALPYTLLNACWENGNLSCTGLDYDNSSLILAHRVRKHFGLELQMHYVTQNGHVFNYQDHDVILIANIVSQKHQVLERVASTARKGAVIVVRNPVTFGEILWEDARYTHVNGLKWEGRFDANPFGECFETVVLRNS